MEGTRILTRADVAELLSVEECIRAVESAFREDAEGRSIPPAVLSVHVPDGGFHTKAAGLHLGRHYFAVKTNGNFFHNAERFGMPRIQGTLVLSDADNGYPLAVIDSIEITILRTGAATAVAAKHLAPRDARVATIIGCGNQGAVSLRALRAVMPIERAIVFDVDGARAEKLAHETGAEVGRDLASAIRAADICVTCTPSRTFFVTRELVHSGMLIAAVGADSSEKQEIEPELLAASRVIADHVEQCATIGDTQHAIRAGVMTRDDVAATLGQVIAGQRPGRRTGEEVVVFDSTGTALQDVAAAAVVYERAVAAGRGTVVRFEE